MKLLCIEMPLNPVVGVIQKIAVSLSKDKPVIMTEILRETESERDSWRGRNEQGDREYRVKAVSLSD